MRRWRRCGPSSRRRSGSQACRKFEHLKKVSAKQAKCLLERRDRVLPTALSTNGGLRQRRNGLAGDHLLCFHYKGFRRTPKGKVSRMFKWILVTVGSIVVIASAAWPALAASLGSHGGL